MSTKWCAIAPLHYSADDDNLLVELSDGVFLQPVPEWLKEKPILDILSRHQREDLINNIRFVLMTEYEADSLGDLDPEWRGRKPKSKQDRAVELIQVANLALWLAKPSLMCFDLVIHADCPDNEWQWRALSEVSNLSPLRRDVGNQLLEEDFRVARELHSALLSLPRDGAVWIAARTLWQALTVELWEIRYPLLWVVLEALFGPKDPKETTYRLSQRIAFFLSSSRKEAKELFKTAHSGYAWRSRVVHGMHLKKLSEESSQGLIYTSEDFVRKALNRILRDNELVSVFSSTRREQYLDDLTFT